MQAKISTDVLLGPRIPRLEGKNKRTSDAEALKQLDVSYYTVINWSSIPLQEIKDTHVGFWPYCMMALDLKIIKWVHQSTQSPMENYPLLV